MLRLLVLFFASGCATLIYETVWFYLVQLVVGSSSISIAVLLCAFMGGMALGSWLLMKLIPPRVNPFRIVATRLPVRTQRECRMTVTGADA